MPFVQPVIVKGTIMLHVKILGQNLWHAKSEIGKFFGSMWIALEQSC